MKPILVRDIPPAEWPEGCTIEPPAMNEDKERTATQNEQERVSQCVSLLTEVLEEDFMSTVLPERKFIITDLLYEGQNAMIYARPGVGKTNLALAIGAAVSRGGKLFGPYHIPKPTGVIFLDGEMPASELQERINRMWIKPDPEYFKVISAELLSTQCRPIPTLVDPTWREGLLEFLKQNRKFRFLIMDNLSALAPGCDELSGLDWDAINQWLIALRRIGMNDLLIHHAGKNNQQRGTSKREDQMDLILKLTKIENRKVSAFRVDFEKARSLPESLKGSFVIEMQDRDEKRQMIYKPASVDLVAKIAFLISKGLSQTAIAEHLVMNQSTVSRKVREAKENGLLNDKGTLTEWGKECCSSMTED
jgi:putative DNA primase/helicase